MTLNYWFIAPTPGEWLVSLEELSEPPALRLRLTSDNAKAITIVGLGDLAALPAECLIIGSGLVHPPNPCGEVRVVQLPSGSRGLEVHVHSDRRLLEMFLGAATPLELRVDLDGLVEESGGEGWIWDRTHRPQLAILSLMMRAFDPICPASRADRVWPDLSGGSRGSRSAPSAP